MNVSRKKKEAEERERRAALVHTANKASIRIDEIFAANITHLMRGKRIMEEFTSTLFRVSEVYKRYSVTLQSDVSKDDYTFINSSPDKLNDLTDEYAEFLGDWQADLDGIAACVAELSKIVKGLVEEI